MNTLNETIKQQKDSLRVLRLRLENVVEDVLADWKKEFGCDYYVEVDIVNRKISEVFTHSDECLTIVSSSRVEADVSIDQHRKTK